MAKSENYLTVVSDEMIDSNRNLDSFITQLKKYTFLFQLVLFLFFYFLLNDGIGYSILFAFIGGLLVSFSIGIVRYILYKANYNTAKAKSIKIYIRESYIAKNGQFFKPGHKLKIGNAKDNDFVSITDQTYRAKSKTELTNQIVKILEIHEPSDSRVIIFETTNPSSPLKLRIDIEKALEFEEVYLIN